jgi:hypothetical protein
VLILAVKHNNSILVISLFIMVVTCFGHSWPTSGQLCLTANIENLFTLWRNILPALHSQTNRINYVGKFILEITNCHMVKNIAIGNKLWTVRKE